MAKVQDRCPLCAADLTGDLVSRRIAVVDANGREWQCPDCLGTWPAREPGPRRRFTYPDA